MPRGSHIFLTHTDDASKILSVFVDEAGDFGELNKAHPYYLVAMVFHDQSNDIAGNIKVLEKPTQANDLILLGIVQKTDI